MFVCGGGGRGVSNLCKDDREMFCLSEISTFDQKDLVMLISSIHS